ncbi:MAG: PASTA domain-containing protein [Chloroflexi bacterium CFX7]|nr:PASTA domain-containing protein [Chloroflexi bacterium CFX7]MCK6565756.1 helix-turn-helix domain-containing protein [Dehalococcoidia bacterium]MCL4232591.1 helix-turn-helix domain-containing protein [Dehalococcoidia bacterium]
MGELGSWLIRAREARGLTLEDAERDTRISRRYLQALEAEQFDVIPAPVYARGFLRSYSQYLGLDPQEMLALFPREEEPAYTAPQAPARPGTRQPPSAVGPARPAWRKPAPPSSQPPRPAGKARPGTPEAPFEPTIGIDIGVPVPTRRIKTDPASQTRSLAIAFVAIIAVLGVILFAMLISRMGDDGGSSPPGLSSKSDDTPGAGSSRTPASVATTVPAGASGLEVTPGIVPNVTGQAAEKARLAIAEAGYTVKERHDKSTQPKGTVVQQSPAPNVELEKGLEVTIVISDGP